MVALARRTATRSSGATSSTKAYRAASSRAVPEPLDARCRTPTSQSVMSLLADGLEDPETGETETLLTVSSDWPFMVSKDSAAEYARYRAHLHAHATREIAAALAAGRRDHAQRLAQDWNRADGSFGALDARRLPR